MTRFRLDQDQIPLQEGGVPRSPRRRVFLTGQFQSLTSTYNVAVRNLSNTGASISCDGPLRPESDGVLVAGGLDCMCRVVWHRAGIFGLEFETPLPNSVVLDLHRITQDEVRSADRIATHEWYQRARR